MLVHSFVHSVVLVIFGALLLAAAIDDIRRLVIPNRLCVAIAILYAAHLLSSPVPVDWIGALGVAGASLAIGLVIFSRGWTGGGDVKLFAATALWAGPTLFGTFLLITSLTGAVIALAMLLHRWLIGRSALALAKGAAGSASPPHSMPYGAAIAAGGLMTVIMLFTRG